jgi:hypothetical protein
MSNSLKEGLAAASTQQTSVSKSGIHKEASNASGVYTATLLDKDGNVKWEDTFKNVVTTVGANLALDTVLAGSAYTAAVVMGLKGTGVAVIGDTQASHAPWLEVGLANAPAYSGSRKTPAWSAASAKSKATSAALSFTFTSGGTVAGCFINLAGSATIDNTTGTLYSAGDFSGGSKTVASTDVLNVTYTASM